MNKKIFVIIFIFIAFLLVLAVNKSDTLTSVKDVISPVKIVLSSGEIFNLSGYEVFDDFYSDNNTKLAKNLNLTEDEAFIFGNLAKYWARNFLINKKVFVKKDELYSYKFGYRTRFANSPYCIKNNQPINKKAFEKQLNTIRKGHFVLADIDTDNIFPISKENAGHLKNFVVVRRSHLKHKFLRSKKIAEPAFSAPNNISSLNIKLLLSDFKTKPDRNCSSDICKEILSNINEAKNTIDIAIYGYSSTPAIEKAIKNALQRGVKIRLVCDLNEKGENIYPDTGKITSIISDNKNDKFSKESSSTMHNKFYIFDKSTVITGSANLSHTDMSGFNSNAIVVIHSKPAAEYFTQEFEQMYSGKFHNDKISIPNKKFQNLCIYFSPQDKGIKNGILPIIKNAKKYIYVPAFVITEKNFTRELINARNRGVDVRVITDALNASTKHSKHKELRNAGISLKAENFAGKMHSKSILIDNEYLIIGSMNFSYSGENRNDENMLIIKDPALTKFYKQFFIHQWNNIPDKWLKYVPRAEGKDSIGSCSDGIDNNYDGFTDADDPACK